MVKMTRLEVKQSVQCEWMLYVDRTNGKGSGVSLILEGPNDYA